MGRAPRPTTAIDPSERHLDSRRIGRRGPHRRQSGRVAAVAAAERVGHPRAELLARIIVFNALYEMAETDRTQEQIDKALALIERLGARRFEPQCLGYRAKILRAEGRRSEAIELFKEGIAISRESGMSFYGPRILG